MNLGGPTYNVAFLARYMPPEFDTILVSGKKSNSEKSSAYILKGMGLKPTYVPEMKRSIHPMRDRIAFNKLKSLIREQQPDIVHTHAAKAGALGRHAAIVTKVPIIVHTFHGHVFHSYFNKVKSNIFLNIERYLARRSDAIIAISEQQKYELTEVYKVCKPEKVKVISLGFDLDKFQHNIDNKRNKFRETFRISDDEVAVGIIGRIVPVKNHELFVRSLATVLQRTSKKVRAFIVGDGEDREKIEGLAANLDIQFTNGNPPQSICPLTFTSWIKDIDEVNAGMDIIALTSLNEGTPVSLIEAQAANKPIVSTKVGGIEDVVLEGETALLSDVNDVDGFSDNLLRLIEHGHYSNGYGQHKGYDFVREKFHYMRLVDEMSDLYKKLLRDKLGK